MQVQPERSPAGAEASVDLLPEPEAEPQLGPVAELAVGPTATEPETEQPFTQTAPPRQVYGHDPLAHWPPGRSLRIPL